MLFQNGILKCIEEGAVMQRDSLHIRGMPPKISCSMQGFELQEKLVCITISCKACRHPQQGTLPMAVLLTAQHGAPGSRDLSGYSEKSLGFSPIGVVGSVQIGKHHFMLPLKALSGDCKSFGVILKRYRFILPLLDTCRQTEVSKGWGSERHRICDW